jgi:hypothetical protein
MKTAKMIRIVLFNVSIMGGLLTVAYFWPDTLIPLGLTVLPIVLYYGFLMVGLNCIAKEEYDSPLFRLRGRRAVLAGQRLIVVGRCCLYIGLGVGWIVLLDSLFGEYK